MPTVGPLRAGEAAASPPAEPSPLDAAREQFARAEALRKVGEHQAAVDALQPLTNSPDPAIAAEVEYRLALLRLQLGYPREAAGSLENLLGRFPDWVAAGRATYLLGMARRKAGDCNGAVSTFFEYQQRTRLLAPQASLELGVCYDQLGQHDAALERIAEALQGDGARGFRAHALERRAAILERRGDVAGAADSVEEIVGLARMTNYKAEIRLQAARLNLALGRQREAATHLAAAVIETPNARSAVTALDRLVALGAQDLVSYYQAGAVRFLRNDYPAAQRNFEGSLATPGEAATHPAAAYYRGVARVRQGAELEGARELLALPGAFPSSRWAPEALLRAGKILESNGRFAEAAAAYARVVSDYPSSALSGEALFRLGLVHRLRGSSDESAGAWDALIASDASPDLRTLGLLWLGKLEADTGDGESSRARWQRAVDLAATWYGGLRARGLLDGRGTLLGAIVPLDPARVGISADERAELAVWSAASNRDLDALSAEFVAEPAVARADELLALGLNAEAEWELEELGGRYAGDPVRLVVLGLAMRERGLERASMRQGQAALDVAQTVARQTPVAVQKLLYPLPYVETFAGLGARYGVDPLLLAALVRQESAFEPNARSSAGALGLAQVMPATGREIAGALGRGDFEVEQLFRPSVSLEFGAYYLGQRLRRYGGSLFPALAGYNAGDGAVDRWLREFGSHDPDLFAERIPYNETNHYVKVVFENYGLYRVLYGAP